MARSSAVPTVVESKRSAKVKRGADPQGITSGKAAGKSAGKSAGIAAFLTAIPAAFQQVGRRLQGFPFSLFASVAILVLALALPKLVPGVDLDREFVVELSRVDLEVVPGWLESEGQAELAESLASIGPVSLRSHSELHGLLKVVESASPWISRISHAEKRYPNQLALSLELRRPVAMIQARDGRWLVDSGGVVIAPAEQLPQLFEEARPLIVFREGVAPRVEAGRELEEPALRAGVKVAADLGPHLDRLRRRGIDLVLVDVTPLAEGPADRLTDINLYTQDGFFVQWGRAEPRDGEPSTQSKLRTLEHAWELIPPFDAVIGLCVQFASVPTFVTRTGSKLASLQGGVENNYR